VAETVVVQRQKLEWYIKLLKELQKIIARKERTDLEIKHALGERIIHEKPNIQEPMNKFVQNLAADLNYSARELWYCIKFTETYPTMDDMIKDFAKSKKIPVEQVSTEDLPTWYEIRNFVLSKGFDAVMESETGAKSYEEPKQCELEKILTDLLTALNPKKAETLNCKECEIQTKCIAFKSKVLPLGHELVASD